MARYGNPPPRTLRNRRADVNPASLRTSTMWTSSYQVLYCLSRSVAGALCATRTPFGTDPPMHVGWRRVYPGGAGTAYLSAEPRPVPAPWIGLPEGGDDGEVLGLGVDQAQKPAEHGWVAGVV